MEDQIKKQIVKSCVFLSGVVLAASGLSAAGVSADLTAEKTSKITSKGMQLYKYWLTGFYSGYQQGFEEASTFNGTEISDQLASFTLEASNAYELTYQNGVVKDGQQPYPLHYFNYSNGYGGSLDVDFQWDCSQSKIRILSMTYTSVPYYFNSPQSDTVKLVWGPSDWVDLNQDENKMIYKDGNYKQVVRFNSLINVESPTQLFDQGLDFNISSAELIMDSAPFHYPDADFNPPSLMYKTMGGLATYYTEFRVNTENLKFSADNFSVNMRTPMSLEACEAVESNS